jgi:hypothetical protein
MVMDQNSKLCELTWQKPDVYCDGDNILHMLKLGEVEKITVLDRLTGYDYGFRDIESGYKSPYGKFWLASGNFDIRKFPNLTVLEAIAKIKENANTCIGA